MIAVTYDSQQYDNNQQNIDVNRCNSIYIENKSDASIFLFKNIEVVAGDWYELENSPGEEFIKDPIPLRFDSAATTFKVIVLRKFTKIVR